MSSLESRSRENHAFSIFQNVPTFSLTAHAQVTQIDSEETMVVLDDSKSLHGVHEKLDHIKTILEELMREMKKLSSRQTILEDKVNAIGQQENSSFYGSALSPTKDDAGKPMTNTIGKMGSSKQVIQSQANSLRCLQDFGLPISSSTNEVSYL